MTTRKTVYIFIFTLLALSIAACKSEQETDDTAVAVSVALTQTAVVPTAATAVAPTVAPAIISVEPTEPTKPTEETAMPTEAAESPAEELGFITGRAHLMAPPTPSLTIYAVNIATGEWVSVDTAEADGEAAYTLELPSGSYHVFASYGLGYSSDNKGLTPVVVNAGQTTTDITLSPPSPSDCGPMFGIPASPDGAYAEIPGPSEECSSSSAAPAPAETEATRIQFAPGDDSAQIFGDILPHGVDHYLISAAAGQEMTVNVDVFEDNPITLAIAGADGTILNQYDTDTTTWTGILPSTQEYYIDILSRYDQTSIDYALVVMIRTVEETNSSYQPPSPSICQIIQETANEAVPATFTLESSAPFIDPSSGESGLGCSLTTTGNGVDFSSPNDVITSLVHAFIGWEEQAAYQADGPTGSATGMTRDMGLLLINAEWEAAPEVQCPSDQPISACSINPEQKLYTIHIQVAQK